MNNQPITVFEFRITVPTEAPKKVEMPSITGLRNHLQYLIDHQAGSWIGQDWVPEQYYNKQLEYSIRELEKFFKNQAEVVAKCKETQAKLEKLYEDLCKEVEEDFMIGDRVIRICPNVEIGPYTIMKGELGTITNMTPDKENPYGVVWDRFPLFKCAYGKQHILRYGAK